MNLKVGLMQQINSYSDFDVTNQVIWKKLYLAHCEFMYRQRAISSENWQIYELESNESISPREYESTKYR